MAPIAYATVPRLFPGETIVCVASGPSLTTADVEFCRHRARMLVVNDNYRKAPWADVLYAADAAWWTKHPATKTFGGLKYGLQPVVDRGDVLILRKSGLEGVDFDPTMLRTGKNSGYQAINLAVHLGARTVVLLGYDLQQTHGQAHWFGNHPAGLRNVSAAQYIQWRPLFATLGVPLAAHGIRIVNCSRQTALQCFPRQALTDVLPERLEAAS